MPRTEISSTSSAPWSAASERVSLPAPPRRSTQTPTGRGAHRLVTVGPNGRRHGRERCRTAVSDVTYIVRPSLRITRRSAGALWLLSAATSLHAQTSAALDAAGSRVELAGGSASSALSLTPSLRWDSRQGSVFAYGSWASFGTGVWSAQGALSGSVYGPAVFGFRHEVGAVAAGTVQ